MARRSKSFVPPAPVVRTGMAIRRLVRRMSDRPLPAAAEVFELSMGFAVTRMLSAVVRLGIADAMAAGPATASQLAKQTGLDADTLHRVLRALALNDVVRLNKQGEFALTRIGAVLVTDAPGSLAPWLRYLEEDSTQQAWAHVEHSLRTGVPAFPARHGVSVWDWFSQHAAEGAQFGAAMRSLTQVDLPGIIGGYPWPDTGVLCDVAGGIGPLLSAILQDRPNLSGILLESPEVLPDADAYLSSTGVRDRVEVRTGDLFAGFSATADTYVLKDVLHDWDDERCVTILRNVRATAPLGAKLIVVEQLQPANTAVFPTSLVDVHMLTQADGGRQRSEAELHALLRSAGFVPAKTHHGLACSMVTGLAG